MLIFLLVVATLLLAYLVYLLRNLARRANSVDENTKLIVKRQLESANQLWKIGRVMTLNFKQEREDFSETRVEELLRSSGWTEAFKYRCEMSADSLEDALAYVRRTAKRIGVSMPGDEKSQTV